jgi:hypothetical protein
MVAKLAARTMVVFSVCVAPACGGSEKSADARSFDAMVDHDGAADQDAGVRDASAPPPECLAAMQLAYPDQPSGLELCGGSWLRVEAPNCGLPLQPGNCVASFEGDPCSQDSDCTEKAHGRCMQGRVLGCHCSYACVSDADCGANEACFCPSWDPNAADTPPHDAEGQCIGGACRSAADCGGKGCMLNIECACGAPTGFQCRSEHDLCRTTADCHSGICTTEGTGFFSCGCGDGWTCE